VEPEWPVELDDELATQIHEVVSAVVAAGGAVGWLVPPDRAACDAWISGVLASGGRLCVVRVDGRVRALGTWQRLASEVLRHNGEIRRVMAHPEARGLGLGRVVVTSLIEDARLSGLEAVLLDVRGNNHAALSLYQSVGFIEYGRLHNFIAVGSHRFDRVGLVLPLSQPDGVVLHDDRPEGPGASTARG
jgi:GNAT superfamily N-acetyltransferase